MSTHHQHHHHSHTEEHFTASETVRDIVFGMADGLTVPFALAAGLAGAVNSNHIILTAGLAEIAAGTISMGLGGYLAARTYIEHYDSEREREHQETLEEPEVEAHEVASIFRSYGLPEESVQSIVKSISSDRKRWIDFMMKFELGLERPQPHRAWKSAVTIGVSYAVGGLIPLSPYFFLPDTHQAFLYSAGMTAATLLIFGYVKGKLTMAKPARSAWQTLAVGGLAAATAYFVAKLLVS